MSEIRKTPRLRFPQYSGEWEKVQLGDVCKIQGGFAFKSELFQESGIPVIRISNISNSTNFLDLNNLVFYNEIPKEENYVIKKGDLLIAMSGATTGKTSISNLETKSYLNQRVGLFKTKIKDIDYPYLIQFVFSSRFSSQLDSFLVAGAQPNISSKDIEKVIFPITSLPEQKKISDFLTSVDRRIELLEKKKSLFETYKKGVMKKIFSQEIRFKDDDGNDFPEWVHKNLKDIVSVKMGQSPDSKSYNEDQNGLPLIQGNADIFNRRTNPRQWTTSPTKVCEIGDLILSVRAPVGNVSKSDHKACIGRGVCSISPINGNNLEFIYQFLLNFEPKWKNIEQGSTFTSVNSNDINLLKIVVPSIPEQIKISLFLLQIDNQIDLLGNQIEKVKIWKKGLLQKMFV
jgi:type I restriction enzyme S subunit